MKVIEVRIDATIRKAEYESEKVGLTALVEEQDDYRAILQELKDFIYGKNKVVKQVKEEIKVEPVAQAVAEEFTSEPLTNEAVMEMEKPKKEKKTKVKEKFETYDRASNVHKKLFSQILDENYPDWEKDTSKAAAASRMMVGENFLDKEGNILQEFKEKVCKLMDV